MIGRGSNRAHKRFEALTRSLADKIKEAILGGKLAAGEKLAEAKLPASVRAHPLALRQALRALEAEGYVSFESHNEIAVSKPTAVDVQDYFTIASALEGLAARLAVERAQPDEIAHLRGLHGRLKEACQKRDLAGYFDANTGFHRFIAEIARNERLYRLIDQTRKEIHKTRLVALRAPQRIESSMREHDQIMDAFLKKNPQLAESAMARHLNNQMETVRKALEETA